jgi:LPXTG-motif cell wall-anchored protein
VQGDPFIASSAPAWPYLAWAGLWLLLVLALGLISFQRREL